MKLLFRILKFVLPYWKRLFVVAVSVFFFALSNVYFMPLIRDLTTDISKQDINMFSIRILEGVLLVVIHSIAQFGQDYNMLWVAHRAVMKVRIRIFEHLQLLSMDFFSKWKSGDIISRSSNDLMQVQNMLLSLSIDIVPQVLSFLGVFIYLAFVHFKLLVAACLTLPVFALLIANFGAAMRRLSRQAQRKAADVMSVLQEVLYGIGIVKVFTREKQEIARYKSENEKTFGYAIQSQRLLVLQQPIIYFLQFSAVLVLIWIGGLSMVKGNLTPGDFLSFFMGLVLLVQPIISVGNVYSKTQQGLAALERVFAILDEVPTVKEKPKAKELAKIKGQVEFRHVSFRYDQKRDIVLKDVDFRVEPGEVVAIVGSSGSGKTTLVNLLPRFYDPSSGQIFIDGMDIQNVTFKSLRAQLAMVTQDTILFSGTILDNIAYGKEEATPAEVEAAAKVAHAHDFISLFPSGYNTLIGERGVRLSGGQKQRLSIARAVLRDPRILILDEATSALDTESERLVQDALDHLMQNRTTFVIAHRLSTIMNADRILVLEDGQIVESGKHVELLKTDSIYKRLYELQFRT